MTRAEPAPVAIGAIVGWATDPPVAARLHDLEHAGHLETLALSATDARRHRLRATTDAGTTVAIALDRSVTLGDGAVLLLDDARAIVVRLDPTAWLDVVPADLTAALDVGHLAGHLHWRIVTRDGHLLVALDGAEDDYRARLGPLVHEGRIQVTRTDAAL